MILDGWSQRDGLPPREIETEKNSENRHHGDYPDHPRRHVVGPEYLPLSFPKNTQHLEFDSECGDYDRDHEHNRDCSHREYPRRIIAGFPDSPF
jgi:hypothetical protein